MKKSMNDKAVNNELINELIIELGNLNNKLNSKIQKSNIQAVFEGIEDNERDLIIESILADKDINKFTEKQYKNMAYYYGKDVDDFRLIVLKILNILLKNYKLFEDIKNPKGNLLSYCFKQPINNTYPNRIWAIFQKYYDKFEEMQGNKLLEPMFIHQTYSADDLDFNYSNKYYVDYYESGVNSRDNRSIINIEEDEEDASENIVIEEIQLEQVSEGGTDEEYLKWKTNNDFVIIRKYDIPYKKTREDNIVLNEEQYNQLIDKKRTDKINKWYKYKNLTAVYPNDIFRYHPGHNYFKLREDSKSKKNENIYAKCNTKKINLNNIVFNKQYETYIKHTIIRTLSKRQQLLIEYLYFELLPAEEVIKLMGFNSKKALNTEKSNCLGLIKKQLLKDYEYILVEYDGTPLAYWIKKIKQNRGNEKTEKQEKELSIL